MSENTIDCFCLDEEQKLIYAGDKLGRVLVLDINSFQLLNVLQVHYGSITTITRHPKYGYLATLGNDGQVGLLKADGANMELMQLIESRNIKPEGDPYLRNHTTTQAVGFHDTKKRLVGHGGSSALFEVEFTDNDYKLIHCTRIHKNDDFLTSRYLPNSDMILSGSVRGAAVLSENGEVKREWEFHSTGTPSIHWFEHLEENTFAIACDGMKVLRLDVFNDDNTVDGPVIARDHLEHTTYCHSSGKLYCASFDRTVMEVDPLTCEKLKEVWKAPFKLRWIKVLEKTPNIMIVQCRNGALYKIDIDQNKIVSEYKTTPDALWSIAPIGDSFIVGGEGSERLTLTLSSDKERAEQARFLKSTKKLELDEYFYTKRLATSSQGDLIAHGRTNGAVLIETAQGEQIKKVLFPAAIRDLEFDDLGKRLFVACENGSLYELFVKGDQEPSVLNHSKVPCWSLSFNAAKNILAFGDRHRRVYCLDLATGKKKCIADKLGFVKCMKWQDEDNLLFGSAGSLYRYNLKSEKSKQLFLLENTVEDFDWDSQRRYIVVVDYTRFLYLCDFETGEVLFEQGDMVDYSKGVMFLDKLSSYQGYPGDFLVVGRSGAASYNRIHDDRILSYGFV